MSGNGVIRERDFGYFLTASGPNISFTLALQAGNINVSATLWDFFDLATSSATW